MGDPGRFESRWLDGDRPSIEGSLAETAPMLRAGLLPMLIEAEVRLRREAGERPTPGEYLDRFPDQAEAIADAFEGHSATSDPVGLGQGDRPGPGPHDSPKAGCRYRIVSHHARGGLGEIFLAEDLELGRTVALKEIRERYALDAQARARFLLEAEVIGKLEHPGIVPIYGLGRYRDGQPYYAMRFVKGDSLREAIDRLHEGRSGRPSGEHELMFRGLLGRLVDACNAIDYAHSRGVLHRDLKPGNIMLGRFGETLVVDWGLAKVLGLDGERDADSGADSCADADATEGPFRSRAGEPIDPTRVHSAIGTPRYMSPEQAAGDLDRIGPASDIFGLGATLYCLLTGRAPYTGPGPEAVEGLARRREFPPPRKVRREVPPPLESICLEAMEAEPARRYPSARALADDVERWLADEPVSVHRYPATVRVVRWGRRHRPLVAAASALLATLAIAMAVSSVIFRAKEKEAEYNFKLAGEVIDQMLVRVGDERLIYVPQMNEVRSELGDEAVRYNKKLLDQHPDDPDLRWNYANKCFRAANNHLLAGRMGRFLAHHDEITRIYRGLIADYPANLRYVNALAFAEHARGLALQQSGDIKSALACFVAALGRAGRLALADPGSANFRTTLARSRMYLGEALVTVGEYPEARGHYDPAIEQATRLVEERPDQHFYRHILVQSLCGRGVVAAETGDDAAAKAMFDRAAAQVDELGRRGDSAVEVDVLRVYVLRERGRWLATRPGCLAEAERAHDEAEKTMKKHCDAYPDVRDYQVEHAWALLNRGLARSGLEPEKRPDAEADLAESIRLLEPKAGQGAATPLVRSIQGQAKGALGRSWLARGDRERAIPLLREALALQRGCLLANQASPIDKKALAEHEAALREAGVAPLR